MGVSTRRLDAVKTCAAAAFLACVTAVFTWPLPLHLAHAVPHDGGDPLLVTWILWWSTHVVPLTSRWWNAPAFYPSAGVFAFSETLLGLAPITAPLLWLGAPPLAAYNAAFLASFLLSGLAGYALGLVLTRRHSSALVAGVAFAFNPYRLSHLNHLQLLASFWMPASLAALHLFASGRRTRWAIVFAAAWLLQALTSGYYFFQYSLLVVLWLLWFARRWPVRQIAVVCLCWFAAALLIVPLLAGYRRIQHAYGFRRVPGEIAYYSADVAGIASAAPESRVWHRLHPVDKAESQLFPGCTLLLVAAWGIARRRRDAVRGASGFSSPRRLFAFYVIAAGAMWVLSLGPAPALLGRPIGVAGPYRILMLLPGFDGIRVPARIWMNGLLCLSAAAAVVISQIESPRVRAAAAAVCVAGLLVDSWPTPLTLGSDPGMQITHSTAAARLGLPLSGNETETMYGAIAQGRPVFNGYSGYTAPQHYALADLLDQGDARIFERLAAGGPIEVVVRRRLDPDGRWQRLAASARGAATGDITPEWTAFDVPASAPVPAPQVGQRLSVARVEASADGQDVGALVDGDLASRWHVGRQSGHETITVDLGRIDRPRWLILSLGVYAGQYPRALDVSTSTDGTAWRSVWNGDTALAAYDAAVRSPRQVPLTIPLHGTDARYVRIVQTGSDPARGWSIVELEVAR